MFRARLAIAQGRHLPPHAEDNDGPRVSPPPVAHLSSFSVRYCRALAAHNFLASPTPPTPLLPQPTPPAGPLGTLVIPSTQVQRPRSGSSIQASSLRPHVPAADRIHLWTTPHQQAREVTESLPPPLLANARSLIYKSFAPATQSTYAAGPLRFTQFCNRWLISESDCMPASPTLLAAFVAEYAGTVSSKAINNWLAGLRAWHIMADAAWSADHDWLRLGRKSATLQGRHHHRAKRAPVSMRHLSALRQSLDLDLSRDACVWAIALTAFFGCRHLGELLPISAARFSPDYVVSRGSTFKQNFSIDSTASSFLLHLPWTKTTRESGFDLIVTSRPQDPLHCLLRAIHSHLSANVSLPPRAPFFSYCCPTNASGFEILTKATFLSICTAAWSVHHLDHVLGHSFRIGGAVELLLAGVPPEVVAATGGWTSLAFLLYWRRMEDILPMSTSRAYSTSSIASLSRIFHSFRRSHNLPDNLDSLPRTL
ncbi:hypothetical protein FISHEDRAFT_42415 [Fistulina hepatica ATCC 64428]|uniref:DNA breaking-rejoining enzyme n=1 Tax=Fistulina hepatica ATCC 64428 TaxID=1128425 RepID=A0A0D7ADY9_9AGAR|nr:hypothetical protein FISHEDRAFT_42415 [Fistulina hepatica ATCC 64428]